MSSSCYINLLLKHKPLNFQFSLLPGLSPARYPLSGDVTVRTVRVFWLVSSNSFTAFTLYCMFRTSLYCFLLRFHRFHLSSFPARSGSFAPPRSFVLFISGQRLLRCFCFLCRFLSIYSSSALLQHHFGLYDLFSGGFTSSVLLVLTRFF